MFKWEMILDHCLEKLWKFIMAWPVVLLFGAGPLIASVLSGEFIFVQIIYFGALVLWLVCALFMWILCEIFKK